MMLTTWIAIPPILQNGEESRKDSAVWLALVLMGVVAWTELPVPYLATMCLVGIALSAVSPAGATAAILSAVPFVFHSIPVGSQRFSPVELAIVIASTGFAMRAGVALWRRNLNKLVSDSISSLPMTMAALALALVGIVSLLFVADPHYLSESQRELRTTILEPIAVLFLVRWSLRHRGLGLMAIALAAAGTVAAVDGIGQFLMRAGGIVGDETYRARGPYPHPNNLALYLERVVILCAGVALGVRQVRWIVFPPLCVMMAGLALTFSRGAFIALGVGVAALIFLRRPFRGWLYMVMGFAGVLLGFAVFAGGRLFATGSQGAESTRELLWRASLRMAADNPVTGVGLDQFLYLYSRRYVEPAGWPERYTSHPHNLFLDVWLRLGLAGLVVFAAIGGIVLYHASRARHGSNLPDAIAAGAFAALVAGFSHGLVDNGFFLPDLAVLTWFCVALVEHNAMTRREHVVRFYWWRRPGTAPI